MDIDNRLRFGKYVESLRKSKGKSLRATAKAIQISPQYYSEVEKGRSNTFTSERLKMLVHFLNLDENEVHTLYDLAAQSRSSNDIVTRTTCLAIPMSLRHCACRWKQVPVKRNGEYFWMI